MSKIAEYQKKYNITEAEAKEMIEYDKAVDKMKDSEVNADLSEEQKKNAKAMRITTEGKRAPTKREKKVDGTKTALLNLLIGGLGDTISEINITNGEREFTFKSGETVYKVVMSVPRT